MPHEKLPFGIAARRPCCQFDTRSGKARQQSRKPVAARLRALHQAKHALSIVGALRDGGYETRGGTQYPRFLSKLYAESKEPFNERA